MNDLNCYSCQHPLQDAVPELNGKVWTAQCPACAVVNKLTPAPDHEGHFTVSGAFFIVHRPVGE